MLEPRRLAARAAARRLASLIGQEPGELVGYQTRDERQIGPNTRIEVVTEGILTRRLQNDPELPGVGSHRLIHTGSHRHPPHSTFLHNFPSS